MSTTLAETGSFTFGKTLHVLAGGHVDASGGGITLNITGDLLVDNGGVIEADDVLGNDNASNITIVASGKADLAAGSRISADNTVSGGSGGNVSITVAGDMTLHGTAGTDTCRTGNGNPGQDGVYGLGTTPNVYLTPSLGARISAVGFGASGTNHGGSIVISVGNLATAQGAYVQERCALVDVSSTSPAGSISITSGKSFENAGLILSESGETGTGATQPPGGGPITIKTGCTLNVDDTGMVSSKGKDPGADLVHLEGCEVLIQGIVQSTGAGHALPNSPTNHCNNPPYPYQHQLAGVSAFTACVEIWGKDVTIDASGSHNGNVNADNITSDAGGPRASWIDIFAATNVSILGDPVGSGVKWAVSATTSLTTDDFAGLITILARDGSVTTTGQAVTQANSTTAGSNGGKVDIEAGGASPNGDVNLDGSFIQAIGGSGTASAGGVINVRSYHGAIIGSSGGQLNAAGGGVAGSVTLTECGGSNQYLGTITPSPGTHNFGNCLGTLNLPANAQSALAADQAIWNACTQRAFLISGTKHLNNLQGAGLPGWTINLYDSTNTLTASQVTDGSGNYTFSPVPPGTYTLCEVMQAGWSQTAPTSGPACHAGEAPFGIAVTIGPNSTGNDFANTQPADCKEDPNNASRITRVVDSTGKTHGPAPVYATIQAAYNAAANAGEVIGVYTNSVENLDLGGAKTLTITQCELARVTAADNTKPVWWLHSTGKLTVIGPDAYGGTVGWLIDSPNQTIKSVRAYNASQYGVWIKTNGNSASFNEVAGSPVGIEVDGNSNTLKSGTIDKNGTGVVLAGGSNTLDGSTVGPNTGNGVVVNGANNTVKGVTATSNGAAGFVANGTGTLFDSNKARKNTGNGFTVAASATGTKLKGNSSNDGNQGGSNENGGFEYGFGVAITNQGSNKINNNAFTATAAGNYD